MVLGAAFLAGLVDAAVGGGGLIQIPALFGTFPQMTPAALFGTNKLASVFGTGSAALRYARQIDMPWGIVMSATVMSFGFSFLGAAAVAYFPAHLLRPLILVLLVCVAAYTFKRKHFGVSVRERVPGRFDTLLGGGIGAALGFYDGFFGPGTGSFLIFLFVRVFGFDFLRASASAKIVNLATNLAALSYFLPHGHVLWQVGAGMAVCNILGAICGAHFALKHGAGWVRRVFLLVVCALIVRFAYDTVFG